jgi:hypothetical protein
MGEQPCLQGVSHAFCLRDSDMSFFTSREAVEYTYGWEQTYLSSFHLIDRARCEN